MTCIHGAEGAQLVNGWLRNSNCEHCAKQIALEDTWKLPAYGEGVKQEGFQGYLELLPEE